MNNINFISIQQITKKNYERNSFGSLSQNVPIQTLNFQHNLSDSILECIDRILNVFKQKEKETRMNDLYHRIKNLGYCQVLKPKSRPILK